MKTRKYHIGLIANNINNTYLLQAVTSKDCLSCGIIEYFGERLTTKKQLNINKKSLLIEFNKRYNKTFNKILIR